MILTRLKLAQTARDGVAGGHFGDTQGPLLVSVRSGSKDRCRDARNGRGILRSAIQAMVMNRRCVALQPRPPARAVETWPRVRRRIGAAAAGVRAAARQSTTLAVIN
jgi:hypothetical protein